MKIALISPYELGRQPFGIAEPAAWLAAADFEVCCVDLSRERLTPERLAECDLIAVHLAMHTATRIAVAAGERLRAIAPRAHLCAYGLYAPVNESALRNLCFTTVLGGEAEPALLALAERLRAGAATRQATAEIHLGRIDFRVPRRDGLPPLGDYAKLMLPNGASRTVAFTEASRGCKHLCRHCPVVPIYNGRFRIVPVEVVLADIRQQIASGAAHVSFGDPDFLNGPTHALRVVRAMHAEWPDLSFDATVKIEHLIAQQRLLPEFAESGCLFLTSAVESIDQRVLEHLAKGHDAEDFEHAVALLDAAGIALAPTFVTFTPWTTLEGYRELLAKLVELALVESVAPIQLCIRLLIPAGSRLLELGEIQALAGDPDEALLGHAWRHPDPRVDALQREAQRLVERATNENWSRRRTFAALWERAHAALDRTAPDLPAELGAPIPCHSEPWFCCAEPTSTQLQAL